MAIIDAAGRNNLKHLSLKRGDVDLEFVAGGEVALTPSSNLYAEPVTYGVENQVKVSDNVTETDNTLSEEPDIAEWALSHPELYEAAMKEEE